MLRLRLASQSSRVVTMPRSLHLPAVPDGDSSPPAESEALRIQRIYKTRSRIDSPLDFFAIYSWQERQLVISDFFRGQGLSSLSGTKILDIGCGAGGFLRRLLDFGAVPKNCFGIDLLPQHVEAARRENPNFVIAEGSAAQLPFADEEFDVVHQGTVFSSVLDPRIKQSVANEALRALRPRGHLIWYDFAYSNPRNPNVRGIGSNEIRRLFRGCGFEFHRVTLAPPIARPAVRFSPLLCKCLWALPFLRTHWLCFIQKPG